MFCSKKTTLNLFISFFVLSQVVFLYFMQVRRINPCVREKLILVWKFLLKTSQMYAKSVFTRNIVHSQEVIYSLKRLHIGKEIWLNSKILPPNFPLQLFWLKKTCWYMCPFTFYFWRIYYNILILIDIFNLINLSRWHYDSIV